MDKLEDSYLVKRGSADFATISSLFEGVRILRINGFTAKGKPVNIYTAQWVDSQTEDYEITSVDSQGNKYVVRENVDLDVTFVVSDKYDPSIDVRTMHDAFVSYMTDGELYFKSEYAQRIMRCVCLKDYKPTLEKLKRTTGENYITGTITLHTLDERAGGDDGYAGNPYPSDEGGGGGGTDLINAQFVKDYALNKTQNQLNAQFNQIPIVSMSVSGKTLNITIS